MFCDDEIYVRLANLESEAQQMEAMIRFLQKQDVENQKRINELESDSRFLTMIPFNRILGSFWGVDSKKDSKPYFTVKEAIYAILDHLNVRLTKKESEEIVLVEPKKIKKAAGRR